jgi:4,5-dihydroxyphthalate decarboxylase
LPYGIEPNRKVLDELIGHAVTQGIIGKRTPVADLFHASTLGLVDVLPR